MWRRVLDNLGRLVPRGPRLLGVPAGVWLFLDMAALCVLLSPCLGKLYGGPRPNSGYVERIGEVESIFDDDEWPEDRDPEVIAQLRVSPRREDRSLVIAFYVEYRYTIQAWFWEDASRVPPERIDEWVPEINRVWQLSVGELAEPDLDRWGDAWFYDSKRTYRIIWPGVGWNLLAVAFAVLSPFMWVWWLRTVRKRVRTRHRVTALAAGRCPRCGYDIRHLPAPRCPECGETWEPPPS